MDDPLYYSTPQLRPYELRPFNAAAPLIVKADLDPFPRGRTSAATGIPGDVESMMSVFDACLEVDQLDRAAMVLQRFEDMNCLSASHLVSLHDRFLRAHVDRFYAHHSDANADVKWSETIQSWYETRIRGMGLPQTATTIACMLKAAILAREPAHRRKRQINRYLRMIPGETARILGDGLESGILTAEEVHQITSLCDVDFTPDDSLYLDVDEEPIISETAEGPQESEVTETITPPSTSASVQSVPQKGLGLKTVQDALSFFADIKDRDISHLSLAERREIQAKIEKDCVDAAINRWREQSQALAKMGRTTVLSEHALNSQLFDWQCAMEARLKEEFKLFDQSEEREDKNREDMDRCLYAPFLKQSTPTRLAAVTIMSVLNLVAQTGAGNGASLAKAITILGKAVEDDVRTQKFAARAKAKRTQRRRRASSSVSELTNAVSGTSTSDNVVQAPLVENGFWSVQVKAKLSAALLSFLFETANVTVVREHPDSKALVSQIQPAFAHTTIFKRGKRHGMIMPNKFLVELMKKEPRADFLARHMPMLVEPEPWTGFNKGGYIQYPSSLIRVKNGEKDQKIYADAAAKRGDLEQVCKGLDVLGRTAWRINRPVFDVMLEAWNSGEALANIPPLNPDIPVPPEPESYDDPLQRRKWLHEVKAAENERSGLHSERCFMNFQLEIAAAFKEQIFYLPHNMDFRGRAYPIPTYLNQMGADHARGLLYFAKGKTLGASGLRWLKVHLANVFGFDKASLSDREAFTTNHLDDIFDSATNPLNGGRWWLKAEDPWQCLAACFEVKAAMQSPNPEEYLSHLPVHQDGTCNGLQHYAALGGDTWGAQHVNLEPGDRPADVYTAVANLVKKGIAEDVEAGNDLAKAMDGKITRKVVKQTVMTNVYGVTFIGARAQVHRQIEHLYPHIQNETGIPSILLASYIAVKIFKALSTMFSGAHEIQFWLGECAGRVCRALTSEQLDRIAQGPNKDKAGPPSKREKTKALKTQEDILSQFRSTIVWTTPLRLPVVQPYRKAGSRTIQTSMQDLNLQISERSDPVNRRKQLQAFPPNFIHSLDASHMLLSAIECDELGLSFAAVHDSFWTHAADIDTMNRVLRDCFIRIHSEDVIERLKSEFEARYKDSLYLAKITTGTALEKEIGQWRKQNKMSMRDELLLERKRMHSLKSSDPAEVESAQRMTTPGSIYEAHSASESVQGDEEGEVVSLGKLPSPESILKSSTQEAEESGDESVEDDAIDDKKGARYAEMMEMNGFESSLKQKKTVQKRVNKIGIWLPLTFPQVPKKGDFDVKRLKESKYFFS